MGEQNILCCSFEMVPTQFPHTHASNSFSILTFPYYCVSRENLLITQRSYFQRHNCKVHSSDPLKSCIFKKYCTVTNITISCFDMSLLRLALTNVFSSAHGMGRFFLCFLHVVYCEGREHLMRGFFGSEKYGVIFYGAFSPRKDNAWH